MSKQPKEYKQGSEAESVPLPSERALDIAFDLRETPEAAREQAVRAACEGDDALEQQVTRLLAAADDADDFLTGDLSGNFSTDELLREQAEDEPTPDIPGYQIVGEIGRGGMGVVYEALDLENANRKIALKVLPPLFDQAARIRFDDECRAMASLVHPNIAMLHHSGIAGDRPFVAMERIEGVPIDRYCDDNALGINERLQLAEQLCFAIAHAHERRLLHQDIKPANLLVANTTGGQPLLKVIDFGISAILGEAQAAEAGRSSQGSLGYVSPERAMDPAGFRADTREDVYAIGVVLFKLLAGTEPPNRDTLHRDPAHTVDVLTATQQREAASVRSLEVERWLRLVRGDLGQIASKAVAVDREDRYHSPLALAEDLKRYREQRPITARPATRLYVLKKAIQRNTLGSIGIALAVLAVLIGGAMTSLSLIRAFEAERDALAQAEAAETARQEAQQTATFLVGLFGRSRSSDPEITRPPSEITAMEMLERGTARIEAELSDQPLLQSRMQATFGQMYHDIALYEEAGDQLDAALDRMRDPSTGPLADQMPAEFGRLLITRSDTALQQSALEDAGRFLLEAAAIEIDREDQSSILLAAQVQRNLGRLYRLRGELDLSREHWSNAVNYYREQFGADHMRTLAAQYGLGQVYFSAQRWAEAETQFSLVLQGFEAQLPNNHSRLLTVKSALGGAISSQQRLEEAAVILEEVLEGQRSALGNQHPRVADALNNLGVTYDDMGDLERAMGYHNEALTIRREAFGDNNPAVAWSLDNLARVMVDLEDFAQAEVYQTEALAIRLDRLGEDHLDTARSYAHLADLAAEREDISGAIDLQQQALRIYRNGLEADHPNLGQQMVNLGLFYWSDGRHDSAQELIESGLTILRQSTATRSEELEETLAEIESAGYTP